MFGENSFGGLSTGDSTNAVAGPSLTQVDGEETDAEFLQLAKTNGEVYVRVSEQVELEGLPYECNLMAVSNRYGLVAVGGQSDVRIHRLEEIHRLVEDSPKDALPIAAPLHVLPLPARPVWLRLAMGEQRLVVATLDGAGICVYKLKDILGGDTTPYHHFTTDVPSSLLDVLPNPAGSSSSDSLTRYTALLSRDGFVIADIEQRRLATPVTGKFTCACWSAKGKQIVVGTKSGNFEQYTPEGTPKARIQPPPELEANEYYPTSVQWLENDLFLASYARHDATPQDNLEMFVIQRTKQSITYTKFFDALDTMGLPERSGRHRFCVDLKQWGPTSKHLTFFASGLASEIGLMHASTEEGNTKWQLLFLDEAARGVLPAAKKGVIQEDTSVLAMEIDLTVTKPVVRGMEGGEDLPDLPPPPRLLVYSQEGLIVSFNIQYPDAGPYPGMMQPQDLPEGDGGAEMEPESETKSHAKPEPPTLSPPAHVEAPKSGFAGFGLSSSTTSAFGASTTPSKPAFGTSAFGQSSTPSFGQSTFGSTTPTSTPSKPAFGQSGFSSTTPTSTPAAKPAPASAFGSTTPSVTPQAKSAFGTSGFGGFGTTTPSSAPSSKPAFGQSGFGAVASGGSVPTAKPTFGGTSIPAFGQTSSPTPSGFGSTAFGQSSKPAFGSTSFGQSTFGKPAQASSPSVSIGTAFGKPAMAGGASAFGATTGSSATSAFGSKASAGGFGFAASSGTSAFGAKAASPTEKKDGIDEAGATESTFGTTASGQSAFGAAKSSGFGSSAFGKAASPASSENKPVFAGFGSRPASSPSSEGQSPFNGFGAKPAPPTARETKSSFAGFGAKPSPSPSSESKSPFAGFGSLSPAASTSVESSSFAGFGGSAKPSAPSEPKSRSAGSESTLPIVHVPASPKKGQDGFGLDGFASMLGESTKATAAPGLESPPPSPPLGSSGRATVPGLEDDTPPSSPPNKPAQTASMGTSAFIKPATGFSGAATSSFGGFGQSSKPAAFGSSSKPAAFSAQPPTVSAFGQSSSSSDSAFGQSSKPSTTSKPAFGQTSSPAASSFGQASKPSSSSPSTFGHTSPAGGSAFGQTSKPLGFGQSTAPKPAGFGNISGGFGGFGASAGAPSGGGFGGFAAKAPEPGQSIFGKSEDGTKPLATGSGSIFGQKKEVSTSVFGPKVASSSTSIFAAPKAYSQDGKLTAASNSKEDAAKTPVRVPPAVLPSGYDVAGPSTAEEPIDDSPPIDVATASSVPLPPTESPAPIRLPAVDSPEVIGRPEDTLSSGSSQEVLVEHEEVPAPPHERDTVEEYEEGDSQDSYEQDDYDYEDEIEGEGQEEYDEDEEDYDEYGYEDDDDEDEDAEDEGDEEEGVEPASERRGSMTIVPPEMSPILEEPQEEDFDEEEGNDEEGDCDSEDDEEKAATLASKAGLKSPPAWFTSSVPSTTTPSPSAKETPDGSSLFSRLGPAPSTPGSTIESPPTAAASKTGPAFNLKHAVRTSSPLGQPPQMAATSPEPSPAKSAFSFFGDAQKSDTTKPLFGAGGKSAGFGLGLGKPPVPSTKSPVEEQSTGGFGGFGQVASASAKEESKPLFGGLGQSAVPSPAAPSKPSTAPSFFAGFGQSAPATIKPETPAGQTTTASSIFSGFGNPPAAEPSPPSLPPAPPVKPPPPSTFVVPTRQSVPTAQQPRDDGKKTMGAVLERLMAALGADLENLKAVLDTNADYHMEFKIPEFPKIAVDNLDRHVDLPFNSINDLQAIVRDLDAELKQKISEQTAAETKLADLQSKLGKSDIKVAQADRFVKARNDPAFTQSMQLKDLSPEQGAMQAGLREMVQSTEESLAELNAGIASLRKRLETKKTSKQSGAPAFDKLQKSVRDNDAAIREHTATIDDLTERISSIRVTAPVRHREATPMSPAAERKHAPAETFRASSEVLEAVDKTVARRERLREQLMARRGGCARVTRLIVGAKAKGDLAHTALNQGPISIDTIPLPGTTVIEIKEVKEVKEVKEEVEEKAEVETEEGSKETVEEHVKAETPSSPLLNPPQPPAPSATAASAQAPLFSFPTSQTPAPTSSGGMFGSIKFGTLDPGPIAPTSASARKSTGGGSTRAHSAAPKFGGGSGLATSPVAAGVSFALPSQGETKPSGETHNPSGFFSLSSFSK